MLSDAENVRVVQEEELLDMSLSPLDITPNMTGLFNGEGDANSCTPMCTPILANRYILVAEECASEHEERELAEGPQVPTPIAYLDESELLLCLVRGSGELNHEPPLPPPRTTGAQV